MKRITAILMAAAIFLSFTAAACQKEKTENSAESGVSESKNAGKIDSTVPLHGEGLRLEDVIGEAVFKQTETFRYNGKAKVPDYSVEPGLKNVVNLNQFKRGVDEVGDYYFAFELPGDAYKMIEKNGFAVFDSNNHSEYFGRYERNRYDYISSFVTTDSALHTFHLMYDHVLKDVEGSSLMSLLKELTADMAEKSYKQYTELKGTKFENAALRNTAFFSAAGKLLDKSFEVKEEAKELVDSELALVKESNGLSRSPIMNFGQTFKEEKDYYMEDYSQYIPRGHYTQSSALKKYFKASMWYGRMTFRSKSPDEVRSAILATSALIEGDGFKKWNKIFSAINFFVGECDDNTPVDYLVALSDIYGKNFASLKTVTDEESFNRALEAVRKMPPPKINSVPIFEEKVEPDRDEAISGFRFLGQRFTIDANIFQRLMDRDVKGRMLPNALDVPASFGSDEAYKILKTDEFNVGKYPQYDGNLQKLKKYVSDTEDGVWTSNLYWSWINTLRTLTKNDKRDGYPFFMRNSAWTRKELNTFIGSWTELKHDTLLYAKQPFGECGGGDAGPDEIPDDRGYVEPNPELFGRLALLVEQTKTGLEKANLITEESADALDKLYEIASKLKEISIKELEDEKITDEDYEFIRFYGAKLEHLWDVAKKDEVELFGDKAAFLERHPDAVVADVASDPNGRALEEATGYAKDVVVAFPRDGKVVLGLGTVYSHYEFTVPLEDRTTDEEWHEKLTSGDIPAAAEWKSDFTIYENEDHYGYYSYDS